MWLDSEAGKRRLLIEQAAVAARFPNFVFHRSGPKWSGTIGKYHIEIRYTEDYPHEPPRTYVIGWGRGKGISDRYHISHMEGENGEICSAPENYSPATNTAVVQIRMAEEWVRRFAP